MESQTICKWCASGASTAFRFIVFSCIKTGRFFKKLCVNIPVGLPKIDVKEPPETAKVKKAKKKEIKQVKTTFKYHNPEAKAVKLIGEFTNWEPVPMEKNSNGDWQTITEMTPGKHTYKFVVDGEWIKDPKNTKTQKDGYGADSSLIEVKN